MTIKALRSLYRSLPLIGVGVVMGALVATCSQPSPSDAASSTGDAMTAVARVFSPTPAFARASADGAGVTLADVAERAVPSVVNISATRVTRTANRRMHPFEDYFGPRMGPPRQQQSLGSGVIVSADGVVLTNNHVVEHAEDVRVTLSDGRDVEAKVVGTDSHTDLAVLRLQGEISDLTPIAFGDSSTLRLGEVVLAIGNPFGVGQTVTMGIVSAKGRSGVGIVDYEDFIQTDAAINPGNSGGALVNMRGELVGINTAILSRSGGNQGIGFAIPSDMARPIMDSLLTDGKVERGWLGVAIQTMDKNLGQALGVELDKGVLVSDVTPDSPAAKAGLARGDVIVAVNGEPVSESSQLRNRIAASGPNSKVTLEVVHEGSKKSVEVTLGALSESPLASASEQAGEGEGVLSGVRVAALDADVRRRLGAPAGLRGVAVVEVAPGTPAQRVGLRPGDVIVEVNRTAVDSVAAFDRLSRQAQGTVALLVYRQGSTLFLAVRP
ncbi:DegQ family serine endoprotease [Haliangium sp.]|uniref:DegQ family serine endoprotease n=1 Tax=Haliangium sp. TaxID=2663208 RepID=UPI003D143544